MKTTIKTTLLAALALALAACGEEAGPAPNIHDSKYAAVGADGATLDQPPSPCVLDQFTGLTWAVKSSEAGLRDWRNTYSWHDPDESHDELDYRGTADGGQCQGSACDTHAYVNAFNQEGLCSYTDWRLPSRDELATISDLTRAETPPTANTDYFPHMQAAEYWSGNDYAFQWDAAWVWSYKHGHDRVEWKASPRHVRLVRGEGQFVDRVKD